MTILRYKNALYTIKFHNPLKKVPLSLQTSSIILTFEDVFSQISSNTVAQENQSESDQ